MVKVVGDREVDEDAGGQGEVGEDAGGQGRLVKVVTTILVEETQHPPEMAIAW